MDRTERMRSRKVKGRERRRLRRKDRDREERWEKTDKRQRGKSCA